MCMAACHVHLLIARACWMHVQVPPSRWKETVLEFLKAEPSARPMVRPDARPRPMGMHGTCILRSRVHGTGVWHVCVARAQVGLDEKTQEVAFIKVNPLKAKFPTGGVGAIDLVANPILLMQYKAEWDRWIAGLPQAVREIAEAQDHDRVLEKLQQGGSAATSVLRTGVSQCAKWSVLETENAFFSSVTTALTVTPFVSMGAIAFFTRSLIISCAPLHRVHVHVHVHGVRRHARARAHTDARACARVRHGTGTWPSTACSRW